MLLQTKASSVRTACESPDLKMDFCSFDYGLKQLYEKVFMQESRFLDKAYYSVKTKEVVF